MIKIKEKQRVRVVDKYTLEYAGTIFCIYVQTSNGYNNFDDTWWHEDGENQIQGFTDAQNDAVHDFISKLTIEL